MVMNNEFEKSDLAIVEYYDIECIDCHGTLNDPTDEWADVIYNAKAAGWQLIDGATYCSGCAKEELERQEEEEATDAATL